MKKIFFLVTLLITAGLVAIVTYKLSAQSSNNGLLVLPSNFDITQNPGETAEKTVRLMNLTDQQITVHVDRRNFTAKGEEGGVEFLGNETSSFSLASWITVTPDTNVVIPARAEKEFTFRVTAPKTAEPGGHFGALVFATTPGGVKSTGAALSQEVASLILTRIPGDVHEQAVVESFQSDHNFYEFGPVNFTARIKNEGGVHIRPIGSVLITDMFGRKTAVDIEPRNVLPGAIRIIPALLKDKLLIGRYHANLILAYGSHNQNIYASTEFWAFPVRYALMLLAVLVVLIFFRKRLFRAVRILVKGK